MSSSSSYNSPCAACKFLRRKCMPDCIFAPYFPPEEPQKFINVHKIFGASNVTKLLNELLPHQRDDAVNSLAYEAEARVRDPVYGCVGAITFLQRQVDRLQRELEAANADLIRITCSELENAQPTACSVRQATEHIGRNAQPAASSVRQPVERSGRKMGSEGGFEGGGGFYQTPSPIPFTYTLPWNDIDGGGESNI